MLSIEVSLHTIDQFEALVKALDALEDLMGQSDLDQVQNLQRLMEPHMESLHEIHDSIDKAWDAAREKKEAQEKGGGQ